MLMGVQWDRSGGCTRQACQEMVWFKEDAVAADETKRSFFHSFLGDSKSALSFKEDLS